MEINGLPAHPLVVHAAVVLAPLAAVLALAYLVPGWRDRLRWPLLVLGVVAALAVVAAFVTGDHFKEANDFFATDEAVHDHEEWAEKLLPVGIAFGVLALLATLLHTRTGSVRVVIDLLLGLAAVALLVLVLLTGEAGAKAVWDGIAG